MRRDPHPTSGLARPVTVHPRSKTMGEGQVARGLNAHPGDTRVGRWRLALTKEEAIKFAKEFHLTEQQVRKWFANRRRRQKKLDNEAAACLM